MKSIRELLRRRLGLSNFAEGDGDLNTQLEQALQEQDLEKAKKLVEQGADVKTRDEDYGTILNLAVAKNDQEYAKTLIDKDGVELNSRDSNGNTPLITAAKLGETDVVKALAGKDKTEINAQTNDRNNPHTALFEAIIAGQTEIAKFLLDEKNAYLNEHNRSLKDVLSCAVDYNNSDLIQHVFNKIKKDEYPDSKVEIADLKINGRGLLQRVFDAGDEKSAELFLDESNINVNKKGNDGLTLLSWASANNKPRAVKLLIEHGAKLNEKDDEGDTPLIWAAKNGNKGIVDILIDNDADTNIENRQGESALDYAIENGFPKTAATIYSAKQTDKNRKSGEAGDTALTRAVSGGNSGVIKALIEAGANTNEPNANGQTPLGIAVASGKSAVAEDLVSHGADPEAKSAGETIRKIAEKRGNTAILNDLDKAREKYVAKQEEERLANDEDYRKQKEAERIEKLSKELVHAAGRGDLDKVKELIKDGADINYFGKDASGRDGFTPLMTAAKENKADVVDFLLKNGADVNKKAGSADAIQIATLSGDKADVVKLLINAGADISKKDANGQTLVESAKEKGQVKIYNYLKSLGVTPQNPQNPKFKKPEEKKPEPKETEESLAKLSLMKAIKARKGVDVIKQLIDRGDDVNARTKNGYTPLIWAAYVGSLEVTNLLLKAGADPEAKTSDGKTAYDWAVKENHSKVAARLANLNLDEGNEAGWTPLMRAAKSGNEEEAETFIKSGANVNAKVKGSGETALIIASLCGNLNIVKLILEKTKEGVNTQDRFGRTALIGAVRNKYADIAKALVKAGAKIGLKDEDDMSALGIAIEDKNADMVVILMGAKDKDEALLKAIDKNRPTAVDFLLKNGAKLNQKTTTGKSLLEVATEKGYPDVVKALLKNGADAKETDSNGNALYAVAKKQGNTAVAEVLAKWGADINTSDGDAVKQLIKAYKDGDKDKVNSLLRAKVDVNAPVQDEESGLEDPPLTQAVRANNMENAQILLKLGADVNVKDESGGTPLHVAAFNALTDMAKFLLDKRAKVNEEDNSGLTPLMAATFGGSLEIVKLLLTKGAGVNRVSHDDGTALDIANKEGHTKIAFYIRYHGGKTSEQR